MLTNSKDGFSVLGDAITFTLLRMRGVRRVKLSLRGQLFDNNAAIGIGTLIIFIAMILVAGMAVSVIVQTMNSLQQEALQTGEETIRDISSGISVSHISGYNNGTSINQLAIFVTTTSGSDEIDLTYTSISISDSLNQVILEFDSDVFSSNVSNGLFSTLNESNLTASTYGIMVIRDVDNSITSGTPIMTDGDLVVLLINTNSCFSGLSTRTEVFGNIIPENGMQGLIGFTTPNVYVDTIIDL